MFNNLSALGYGLVTFAIIIGVGTVILSKFGDSVATCSTGFAFNSTQQLCVNATNATDTAAASNQAYTNTAYLNTQLGTTGLAGWTPAIIAFVVGMLFLGAFMAKGGRKA